ncbi:transposase [Streptomyces sp. NPDC058548]|uniref:transposase n=1 Tax=unclassified Streptomyces TaxID=2593676 RepID=UPI003651EA10
MPTERVVDSGCDIATHILTARNDHGITQGAVSSSWSDQRKPSGAAATRVHLALADCDPCPLRPRCTKATSGKWGRSLTLLPREQHQTLARQSAEQQTAEWKARHDVRDGIEDTVSPAVHRTRLRHTPYRGQPKTHIPNVLSATTINLVRVDAWLNSTPLGTTHPSHLTASTLPHDQAGKLETHIPQRSP